MTPFARISSPLLLTSGLALTLPAGAAPQAEPPETEASAPAQAKPAETAAPRRLPQEINLNLFRNPSIGLEYRLGPVSVHAGAYPTVISQSPTGENETSWFFRAGLSAYFLGHSFYKQRESEFYISASYLRGLNLGHENAAAFELGYRWMVWKGLNVRLGAAVLLEPGREVQVNPTPGIGWSHAF